MASAAEILRFADEVVEQFQPQRIILFGSHAYGVPTEDSDVDLLVIMPCQIKEFRKAAEISLKVSHRFPMDLIVRTPDTMKERLAWNDCFLKEIVEKGVVLHDAADPRVGDEGRGRLQQRFAAVAGA